MFHYKVRYKIEVWRNNERVSGLSDPNIEVVVGMMAACNEQRSVTIWFEE